MSAHHWRPADWSPPAAARDARHPRRQLPGRRWSDARARPAL